MSADNIAPLMVTSVQQWTATLFSFRVTRPAGFRFTAGQFVSLGMNPNHLAHFNSMQTKTIPEENGFSESDFSETDTVFRAYSIVSSEYDEYLEFFSVVIPDGAFTSCLQYLQMGDTLWLKLTPVGFLTLARYQLPAPQDLWLLATGTGIAPFLSILKTLEVWEKYQQIVLVYSVRHADELAYAKEIASLREQYCAAETGASLTFIPVVTRDADFDGLTQRLPELLLNGELEKHAKMTLNPQTSHIMLCGNPQMVEDTKETLKKMGLTMNRRGEGNIAVENYW